MWQERQIELIKSELDAILAPLSSTEGLLEIIKEPLVAARQGLSIESIHEKPWLLLPLVVCEAISSDYKPAVPVTIALHLIMAAGDVLDDIEDNDSSISLSSKYGFSIANNAATTLLVLAEKSISRLRVRGIADYLVAHIMDVFNTYNIYMCRGQHLDLSLSLESNISEESYLEIISMKSASQIECACHLGALLATENQELIDIFTNFGHNLGMAAQITNDINDVIHGSDIEKKKLTLPLVYTSNLKNMENAHKINKTRVSLYESVSDPEQIKELLFRNGAIHYSMIKMQFYKQLALDCLSEARNKGINTEDFKPLIIRLQ